MLITAGVTLYSTRLVLNALGASDYGIFTLVAGVIAMLSFLNAAMTVSTQRYLSFHQGTGDTEMQRKIFTNSWILHIIIGVFVVAALWALTPFLFGGFLNIPADRMATAKTIYRFMSVSVFFTIIAVPFSASLNAHENMLWIAIVAIVQAFLKLAIAWSLAKFIQAERLVMFGMFTAALSFVAFLLYAAYCLRKYSECSIKKYRVNKPLMKELSGFAGWNLFGAVCGVGRMEGLAVILNVFLGTVINAAYGIATQVLGQLYAFSQTMLQAINPQIMKSEGMNDRQRMLRLSMTASKCSFFLLALISIPIIFEMPAILKLWLTDVPEYTAVFCSLILIAELVNQLTFGLQSSIQAIGKIKMFQTGVGIIVLLNLPVACLLLKLSFPPYSVVAFTVVIEFIACVFKLFCLKKLAALSIREYFERVILKEVVPLLTIIFMCRLVTKTIAVGDFRFLITGMVSVSVFAVSIYFTGLCRDEKKLVNNMLKKIIVGYEK
jgi:O-antigen/teichoic acid export membrane protein